jgi:hypothetical protein
MAGLFDAYKQLLFKKGLPDDGLFIPLLYWCSGNPNNIEVCQEINRKFYKVPGHILLCKLYFEVTPKITKYPKKFKEDKDTKFFYIDLAKYFGWTKAELYKNLKVIDVESMKEIIAQKFGYDNKERKLIKLKKIKGVK